MDQLNEPKQFDYCLLRNLRDRNGNRVQGFIDDMVILIGGRTAGGVGAEVLRPLGKRGFPLSVEVGTYVEALVNPRVIQQAGRFAEVPEIPVRLAPGEELVWLRSTVGVAVEWSERVYVVNGTHGDFTIEDLIRNPRGGMTYYVAKEDLEVVRDL